MNLPHKPTETYNTDRVSRPQNPKNWPKLLIGLGLAASVIAGRLIARRKSGKPNFAKADTWRKALIGKYGTIEAEALMVKLQQRYEELYRARSHYDHPALRKHLAQNILPGLTLYQVLLAEGNDQAAALAEVEQLLYASAVRSGLRQTVAALKFLPEPFTLLRPVVRAAMRFGFPAAGWETDWLEDSDQRIAFNIRRCFYLDTLTTYGAPELTPLFCRMDDVVYEALPASIRWERTGTLGRGNDRCDFCYRHTA
ncbi:MAG: L-2-amino-thiazoline-4-carboxylic acid hydrolase [Thermoflexales bacterium]|nr:L-2-amino-thiazoline-4-carboxylic acid hydrolase [Thermoflexales bacterium]